MTPTGQRWTREKPKEAGWYWFRLTGNYIAAIHDVGEELDLWLNDKHYFVDDPDLDGGEWQGPIHPNEATE